LYLLVLTIWLASVARADDVEGYNPYHPASKDQDPKFKSDPKNFDDAFPATTPGSSSQRAALAGASNCFMTGGGEVPEYYICRGHGDYMGHRQEIYCQTDEALHCLDDLRNNYSRNVPVGCSYTVKKIKCEAVDQEDQVGENRTGSCNATKVRKSGMQLLGTIKDVIEWGACCPKFTKESKLDAFRRSAAYPDALLCLERANCDREPIFEQLQAECAERCCEHGECRYPMDHPTLAGLLLPDYQDATFTAGGPCGPSRPLPPAKAKAPVCFSGDDSVSLESGATKQLRHLEVGDRVLAASPKPRGLWAYWGAASASASALVGYELGYSDVVYLPHALNRAPSDFVEVRTLGGKRLRATPDHLLLFCDGELKPAKLLLETSAQRDTREGIGATGGGGEGPGPTGRAFCLETVDGAELVTSARLIEGSEAGVYTLVVQGRELVAVGGILASPFAHRHAIPHAYYQVHRAIYAAFGGAALGKLESGPAAGGGLVSWAARKAVGATNAAMGAAAMLFLELASLAEGPGPGKRP